MSQTLGFEKRASIFPIFCLSFHWPPSVRALKTATRQNKTTRERIQQPCTLSAGRTNAGHMYIQPRFYASSKRHDGEADEWVMQPYIQSAVAYRMHECVSSIFSPPSRLWLDFVEHLDLSLSGQQAHKRSVVAALQQ